MTPRPELRWRIGILVVIGFLALMTIPIALYYALVGTDEITGLPQPRQMAAIVALAETAAPQERARAFNALQSAQLSVRIAPEAAVTTDLDLLWPKNMARAAKYTEGLGGREFAAYSIPRGLFRGAVAQPLRAAEFRVGLRTGGVLIVASESVALFSDTGVPIGFPAAFLGVLLAFVALFMLNREFRPVLRLARAVEAINPKDPSAALPEIRARAFEVRQLIDAFHRQQAQVTQLLNARAALIGGIQHDVRTFATRLRMRVEHLSDPEDRRLAEADIDDLVSLMDTALLATRGEANKLDLELIDFGELVRDEIQHRKDAGLDIHLHTDPNETRLEIVGDRLALRRILFNIFENALRYGKSASVTLSPVGANVTLFVDDAGPGIPKEQRDELMQPFSRLEASRSRQTGGAGLGLSIVQTLVSAHDGHVEIDDAPTGGARIVVTIPKFRPSAEP
ncbi:MAG: ATP-binding protein [Pseudomonadota bacterium]